ncbi:MAG: rRNA maturation RNase YbeY [Rhodospirillaceae bacterium]|nr:rRNA maturation RNase YbeY [Rhodospirillaceae bacterium]
MTVLATTAERPEPAIDIDMATPAWREFLPGAEDLCRAAVAATWLAAETELTLALVDRRTEVSVRLADDDDVAALNFDYRERQGPTNVLSFPAALENELTGLPPEAPVLLGDIVLALGVVEREAVTQSKAPADHFSHLVVHGMLHLLGYDHIEADDAEIMEKLETVVLAGLRIADPYDDIDDGSRGDA